MRTYLIDSDQITAHFAVPKSISEDALLVRRIGDLNAEHFTAARLLSLWNALPATTPMKRFKTRADGVERLWQALTELPFNHEGSSTSKQSQLIALLRRDKGASMGELMSATGWQAHSVRGALSGVLRKKLALDIELIKTGNSKVYRIADAS